MAFGFLSPKAQVTPESDFWKWFVANEMRLFSWESNQEATFDMLATGMEEVHPDLTFEFGPVTNGKREFVISAGGIKAAFPSVEALYNAAPLLKRWQWAKFRPRRASLHDIEFEGKSIRVEDVHYVLARDGAKAGIVLFFDGYNTNEKDVFNQIGYLMLDEALGEYAVEMQVGFIKFLSRESEYFHQAAPIQELAAHFDEFWARAGS